jgi:hypothetical protein
VRLGLAIFFAFVVADSGTACADQVLYVTAWDFTQGNSFLGTIDVDTGAFNEIGTFALPERTIIWGIGYTGPGQLTAMSNTGELYSVNTSTAALTPLENVGIYPSAVTGDGNGNLIVADYNNVWKINVATGASSILLAAGGISDDGLIAQSKAGQIYLSEFGYSPGDEMFRLDPQTGKVTDLGNSGADAANGLYSGAFIGSTLYGLVPIYDSNFIGNQVGIDTVDPTTGLATQVGLAQTPNGDDLWVLGAAYQAVPEPSAVVLMALGILGVGCKRFCAQRLTH